MKRAVICASSAFAACIVVVFMLSSRDASIVVHEESATMTSMPNGMATSNTVPESTQQEGSSVLLEEEPTAAPADADAPAEPEYPADIDQDVWNKFTSAKEDAAEHVSVEEFQGMEYACMGIRKQSALDCGELYCAAEGECGKPCAKPYGMPPAQVVPLQPGGPKFHRVAEVDNKEKANKELHAKEVSAKERAVKEHAEKAKEKAAKEVDYKKALDEEKTSKESAMKAHAASEAATKHQLEGEISSKESAVKANFTVMEQHVESACSVKGDEELVACEEEKAQKAAEEVEQKKAALEAAQAANVSDVEDVYAIGNATADMAAMQGEISAAESAIFNETHPVGHYQNGSWVAGPAPTPPPTPAPTSYCNTLSIIDCITEEGCHYDDTIHLCAAGDIPGEFVNGTETATTIEESWDPIAALNSCVDDADWMNDHADGCGTVTVDWCLTEGTATFPGYGCGEDGSGCKTGMEACCICQTVASPEAQTCVDDPMWRDSEGNSCTSDVINTAWCTTNGNDVYPGSGCSEDGTDCKSAFEACCMCQTGADLGATEVSDPVAMEGSTSAATTATGEWTVCASEGEHCSFSGTKSVRYGFGETFNTHEATDGTDCNNDVFGDPLPGVHKECQIMSDATSGTAGLLETGFTEKTVVAKKQQSSAVMGDVLSLLRSQTPDRRLLVTGDEDLPGAPIPTEPEIDAINEETDGHIAEANEAAAVTAEAAERDLHRVADMVDAANNATLYAMVAEQTHQEDVTASGMYEDLVTGLEATSSDIDADADNKTAILSEEHDGSCATVGRDTTLQCHVDHAEELKANLTAMSDHAQEEHQFYLDKAAADADEWGRALEDAKAAEEALVKAEAEAAADLAAHIASQPVVPSLAMMQADDDASVSFDSDEDKCHAARHTAYAQCRDSQNAAYESCLGIFSGETVVPPAPPVASGSAAAFVAEPAVALQSAIKFRTSMLKPAGKAAPASPKQALSPAEIETKKQVASIFDKFTPATEEQLDAPLSDAQVLSMQNKAWGGEALLQEAGDALKEMGFPSLPKSN